MKKELFIAIGIGIVGVIFLIFLLNPFYEKYHFVFRFPLEFHWPIKLEKRPIKEKIRYILVTPTSTPFPRFKLEEGVVK